MPGLRIHLEAGDASCEIGCVNKNHRDGVFSLYTEAWGKATPVTDSHFYVRLLPEEGQSLSIGGELRYTLLSTGSGEGTDRIGVGEHVLCYSGAPETWELSGLASLESGTEIIVSVSAADPRFEDCTEALGCLFPLVYSGSALDGLDDIDRNNAPRTAIGICDDGTVILYTADGRQSGYATGLTLKEVAERLIELGCVAAGALDGGASTVLGCQFPGSNSCEIRNSPSLGHLRETPQFLLLSSPAEEPGELCTIAIYSDEKAVLSGASCVFACGGCDRNGAPVAVEDAVWETESGSIDADGVFTAPENSCEALISVRCGTVRGFLTIPVVSEPDSVSVYQEEGRDALTELRVLPGSVTDLHAVAVWNGISLCSDDQQFVWTSEDSIGTVDENGVFTASDRVASGTITLSLGEASASLNVSVTDTVACLEDFESAPAGSGAGVIWGPETGRDRVRYGIGSLRLDYDLSEGSASFPLDGYPTELGSNCSFWVLSDGSGNNLYSVHDGIAILLGSLEHRGWMQFTVDTRQFGAVRALRIGGSGSGTLWIDQLTIHSQAEPDTEAPVIRTTVTGNMLSAEIMDTSEGVLGRDRITLVLNGVEQPFDYDEVTGKLNCVLAQEESIVHAVLTAADRSGNYNSSSVLLSQDHTSPFTDMPGHWAQTYTDYLYFRGVAAGRPGADGSVYYDPDTGLTRAEFAVLLCRWLGIDTSVYEDSAAFYDQSEIPAWAEDSVRAANALGLILGSEDDGLLRFLPYEPITRAQAAVILGRTMPGGRMSADLPWEDSGEIPDWAATYVAELTFMGIMSGTDGYYGPGEPLSRAEAARLLAELS